MVRVTVGFLCLALLALPVSLASAQDLPDLAAVQHHVEDAIGKRPAADRLAITYTAQGMAGRDVTLRSGDDYRTDTTLGPFKSAEGSFHGQDWSQNENGETVLDNAEPGVEIGDRTTTRLTRISQPLDAYVITKLNLRGSGSKQYIDPATWHVVRRDYIRPTGTSTVSYDDFRTTGTYTCAWHWAFRDGHAENDEDYRIESLDPSAVSEAELAIPPARRTLAEFPAGISSVALPVHLIDGQFIVRVNINGRGLDFQLDTGAGDLVIDRDVAKQLGLEEHGAYSSAVNAGRYVGTNVIVPEMKVGNLTMHDVVVSTIPHVAGDNPDYKIVGLLGFDFIDAVGLKLDYEAGTMTATTPDAFEAPTDPRTIDLDVRLGSLRPQTSVAVNGVLGQRFILDTGATGGLMLFDYFQRRNPDVLRNAQWLAPNPNMRFIGVGGEFEVQPYRLRSVTIGQVNFTDFIALAVTSGGSYSANEDGLIGTDLLALFTLYTDYANGKVYLAPNGITKRVISK